MGISSASLAVPVSGVALSAPAPESDEALWASAVLASFGSSAA